MCANNQFSYCIGTLGMAVLLLLALLGGGLCSAAQARQATYLEKAKARLVEPLNDEFVGPFRDWVNIRDFGAVGDGKADDTVALQRALDSLGLDLNGKPLRPDTPLGKTLYLPAGTYRITRGLIMTSDLGIAIYGEHPENTIIRWDGPGHGYQPGDRPPGAETDADKAATMLYLNGVRHARFGRITWDGAGKALTAVDHEWDRRVTGAATMLEHEDEVFKDVGFGLRAGDGAGGMDAEGVVKRCHFLRNTFAGVSIESFNALNWWVWSSLFEDCRVGATNEFGAGAVDVYNSLFVRSREADIRIMHVTSFLSARHNVSLGSRRFYESVPHPTWPKEHNWSGLFTLQDNLILGTTSPEAVYFKTVGPLVLLDNEFAGLAGAVGAAIKFELSEGYQADCVAVGNTFTRGNPLSVMGRLFDAENRVIANGKEPLPTAERLKAMLPSVAPRYDRPVIEPKPGDDLQLAINKAAAMKGKRPIVYLGRGAYALAHTLIIPARTDLQLVGAWGEGVTMLSLSPNSPDNVVIRLDGPSHATLRRFSICGVDPNNNSRHLKNYGTGLLITGIDQQDARVWSPRVKIRNCSDAGLWMDGLRRAATQWFNFEAQYNEGDAVRVTGPLADNAPFDRQHSPLQVIFNGNTSANNITYALTHGARLLARDLWYEGPQPRFFKLDARGDFTLDGASISTYDWHAGPHPACEVRQPGIEVTPTFQGRLALLSSYTWGSGTMTFNNDPARSRVLVMANLTMKPDEWLSGTAPTDTVTMLYNRGFKPANDGTYGLPQQPAMNQAAVLDMLCDLRSVRPQSCKRAADNVTDVCLHDMFIRYCKVGILVTP